MNLSGIKPIEYNVLIRQVDVEEKTKGGMFIPQDVQDRNMHSETRGRLVAVSPMAFTFDDWPAGESKPEVGQEIIFAKHAGTFVDGLDGEKYRVVKDKDVVAVISDEVAA